MRAVVVEGRRLVEPRREGAPLEGRGDVERCLGRDVPDRLATRESVRLAERDRPAGEVDGKNLVVEPAGVRNMRCVTDGAVRQLDERAVVRVGAGPRIGGRGRKSLRPRSDVVLRREIDGPGEVDGAPRDRHPLYGL